MLYYTIQEILTAAEKQFGHADAIRWKKTKNEIETRSYTQLKTDSECFSAVIETLKETGNHIALIGTTSYAWIAAYFGIVNSTSVAVPLDASLPVKELCELMDRADVTLLLVDGTRADVATVAKENCPKLKTVLSLQQEAFEQLLMEHGKTQAKEIKIQPEQLCTIMFTSGTTGKSKGVMLTHRNLAENATCLDMKIPERTVVLSVLPIHHAYCLSMDILKGISIGSVICINDSIMHMAANIKFFQPDMMLMVPLMIETFAKKFADAKVAGLPLAQVKERIFGSKLHTVCSGGAYLSQDNIDLFEEAGIAVLQGYGMTECSPVISTMRSWEIRRDSVGKLLPNCRAKTVDDELWVQGSSVMQGYYHMPEETKAVLEDGWLKTGDLGYVDADGFVYLTGRKKNLIITKNGENVSPEEIENKLGTSRLVQEILVREAKGVIEAEIYPDFAYAAQAEIADVSDALQKKIDAYNETVPGYKRVYRMKIRDTEFEKTASRKIKRY